MIKSRRGKLKPRAIQPMKFKMRNSKGRRAKAKAKKRHPKKYILIDRYPINKKIKNQLVSCDPEFIRRYY
jgi:hypothetical protein